VPKTEDRDRIFETGLSFVKESSSVIRLNRILGFSLPASEATGQSSDGHRQADCRLDLLTAASDLIFRIESS